MKNHSYVKGLSAFSSADDDLEDSRVRARFFGGLLTSAAVTKRTRFYAAFKIPNLLRRFLGEGSLTAAFVPVFTETLHKQGPEGQPSPEFSSFRTADYFVGYGCCGNNFCAASDPACFLGFYSRP